MEHTQTQNPSDVRAAVLVRLAAAWQAGVPPDLGAFLGPDTEPELIQAACRLDVERRVRGGHASRLEEYARRFPALPEFVELVKHEWSQRRGLGQTADASEYRLRFPELAEQFVGAEPTVSGGNDDSWTLPPMSPTALLDPPTSPDEIGRLGKYSVLRVLGEGGMGIVFEAIDPVLKRPVALKIIKPKKLDDDDPGGKENRRVARFLAEAEAIAATRHPNVVQVYEVGDRAGRPFLALELCRGGTLSAKFKQDRPSLRPAVELVRKIAAGVQAAHEEGIVHRDLKPANVLFDEHGEPKVTDFGLAKRAGGTTMTQTQAVMGTPAFMSPEQARGERALIGPASDVWALGVILYQALSGRRPYEGDDSWALLGQIASYPPTPLKSYFPTAPKDLQLICAKCLSRDPRDRYPTAGALAADLDCFLEGRTVTARPANSVTAAVRWGRRNPAFAGVVVLLFGVLIAASAVMTVLWKRADRDRHLAEDKATEANDERLAAEASGLAADKSRRVAENSQRVARSSLDFQERLFLGADPFGFHIPVDTLSTKPIGERTVLEFLNDGREQLKQSRATDPLVRASIQFALGSAYRGVGDLDQAEPLLLESLAVRERELGRADPDYLASLQAVGFLRHSKGQHVEAFEILRDARRIAFEIFPPDDPRRGDAAFFLAFAALLRFEPNNPTREEGEAALNEAERVYLAVGGHERELGRVRLARTCVKLYSVGWKSDLKAMIKDLTGDLEAGQKDAVGGLLLQYFFSTEFRKQGKRVEAEKMHGEVLLKARQIVGVDHPMYILALGDYAGLLKEMNRFDEAEVVLAQVITLYRRSPLRDHPLVLPTFPVYADFMLQRGKPKEAEAALREALALAIKLRMRPEAMNIAGKLAPLLRDSNRVDEATAIEKKAAAVPEKK